MREVDSFKKSHSDNGILVENSERMIKQLQEGITFLRQQLENKDEVFHSLLQQLAKRDYIVVECNRISSYETSNKMHCSVLSNHNEVQQNTTHEELLLDTSIIVNETDIMNAKTESCNLTAKIGNGNKHQQNKKKIQNKNKIKNQGKNRKKKSQLSY